MGTCLCFVSVIFMLSLLDADRRVIDWAKYMTGTVLESGGLFFLLFSLVPPPPPRFVKTTDGLFFSLVLPLSPPPPPPKLF